MTITLAVIIVLGLLGTLILGWAAYRHLASLSVPRTRTNTTQQPVVAVSTPPLQTPASRRAGGKKWAAFFWGSLVALTGVAGTIGAWHLIPSSSPPPTASERDTIFTVVARPGQPAEVVMPPGWRIEWAGKEGEFSSHAIWRGKEKVQIFVTKAGVASAEIKIRKYYQPAGRR